MLCEDRVALPLGAEQEPRQNCTRNCMKNDAAPHHCKNMEGIPVPIEIVSLCIEGGGKNAWLV
jgi:hypothetical protein